MNPAPPVTRMTLLTSSVISEEGDDSVVSPSESDSKVSWTIVLGTLLGTELCIVVALDEQVANS